MFEMFFVLNHQSFLYLRIVALLFTDGYFLTLGMAQLHLGLGLCSTTNVSVVLSGGLMLKVKKRSLPMALSKASKKRHRII